MTEVLQDSLVGYNRGSLNSSNADVSTPPPPPFMRMIVLEVISDPNGPQDYKKKAAWQQMGIKNMSYANHLPRNTIVARFANIDDPPMFVFPFFPSHLSLPCKPGEAVWVVFPSPDPNNLAGQAIAYWFCKIVEPDYVDDVNHTHPGRHLEPSFFPSPEEMHKNEKEGKSASGAYLWHELRNGPVAIVNGSRVTLSSNKILVNEKSDDVFEKLISESDAGQLTVLEAIPRYRKRPGDVVLEGSNNSLIVMGTDRKDVIAEYVDPITDEARVKRRKVPSYPKNDSKFSAGMIDIVAGRGQTSSTFGKFALTTSVNGAKPGVKGPPIGNELIKVGDFVSPNEGDPDLVHDRSRILISQRTMTDRNFGLKDYNTKNLGIADSTDGDASIVIKSDKIRLFARSDVEIIVTNYEDSNAPDKEGTPIKKESTDQKKWASIVIKKSGDIIMNPSEEGYIKLGGDDASLAVLCQQNAVTNKGTVTAKPIVDSMLGQQGDGVGPRGKFATKVLMK